jgi:hypothetical protein
MRLSAKFWLITYLAGAVFLISDWILYATGNNSIAAWFGLMAIVFFIASIVLATFDTFYGIRKYRKLKKELENKIEDNDWSIRKKTL